MWSALSFKAFLKLIVAVLFFSFSNIATAQLACKYNLDEVIYPSPIAACEGFQERVLKKQYTGVSGSRIEFIGLQDIVRTNSTGFGLPDTYYLTTVCNLRQYSSAADILGNGHSLWITCNCTEGYRMNQQGGCESPNAPVLTLTPAPNQKDPRPKRTEGKDPKSSTHELIAKVTENGSPKAGVAVIFKVEVKEGSGEHGVTIGAVHDHRVRKEKHNGEVKPLSGTTTASGEVRIKFEAPEFAGTHTITATCETCSNKTVTKDVKVLVPDLVALTADTGTPKMFSLVGNTGDPGANHPDNHYFTPSAKLTLTEAVIPRLFNAGWGVVGVNDGSLKDGGLFDLEGQWNTAGGHAEHRKGTEVDIRTRDNSPKMIRKGYDALCDKEEVALGIQTLWHKKDGYGEHFHLYLSGIGLRADAIGGCCAQVIGPKKNKDGTPLLDKQGNPIRGPICE